MAKKSTKKASSKSAGKKAAPAKPAGKKSAAKKSASTDPRPVKTGKGAAPIDIGSRLVADFNNGKVQINDELWSKDIVSVEGLGTCMAWHGRKAVDAKNAWWSSTHKIHGASAEGPYVGASGFSVKFKMEVEDTANGQRMVMTEIGIYTVQNGKIVREEFMYGVG